MEIRRQCAARARRLCGRKLTRVTIGACATARVPSVGDVAAAISAITQVWIRCEPGGARNDLDVTLWRAYAKLQETMIGLAARGL